MFQMILFHFTLELKFFILISRIIHIVKISNQILKVVADEILDQIPAWI